MLVLAALVWKRNQRADKGVNESAISPSVSEIVLATQSLTPSGTAANQAYVSAATSSNAAAQITTDAHSQGVESKNMPINFYGKVIDQDKLPVIGAKITIRVRRWQVSIPASVEATYAEHALTSDSQGNFQLIGQTGDSMELKLVDKIGYELSPRAVRSFVYSGPVWFSSKPEHPVVFRLWKKGRAEPLIVHKKFFGTIPDGRLTTFDVFTGKKFDGEQGNGTINLRITRPLNVSRRDKYDWMLTAQVAAGGILASEDEFMRWAPESGYSEKFVIQFKQTDMELSQVVKRRFFIKTQQGIYGHIELEAYPFYDGEAAFQVTSVVNPSGSRNLEYDEAVQPKPTVHE